MAWHSQGMLLLDFSLNWVLRYTPGLNPEAFRIAKTNQNVLQEAADPEARFDRKNRPYSMNGVEQTLRTPSSNPAVLLLLAEQTSLLCPPNARTDSVDQKGSPRGQTIYYSHIQVRSDLVEGLGGLKGSLPVGEFVLHNAPLVVVAFTTTCTDRQQAGDLLLLRDKITNPVDASQKLAPVSCKSISLRSCGHGVIGNLGSEVKVSKALCHGKSVIAMRAGGIPLHIQRGKSGFLVEVGDIDAVANHLFDLYTNRDLYTRMSEYAKASVSGEVENVGNAACWLYSAAQLERPSSQA
ncbi:hypothetical protein HOY80DRAFT_1005283 [Tuber brumale]|nr:hypothetical protein HOY80DRAFT_1005283 [Tuber brumale]